MGKVAFLFPGQGSQHVGMGKDFTENDKEAEALLKQADETIDFPLTKLMFEGPEEELKRTENAQPSLFSVSATAFERLRQAGITPDFVAGHSLGEYSALYAGGVLSFTDAVHAVRQRGLLMEEAVPTGDGAMTAIMGLEKEKLELVCEEASNGKETAELANLNAPGQIVISGTKAGVEKASNLAKEKGAKRVIPLQVSGPFHSSLMAPAKDKLESVLDTLEFSDAKVPIVCNVTAEEEQDANELKHLLLQQVTSPVRWEETIRHLLHLGVDTFVEVGPGKVLSGLVRRVQRRGVQVYTVNDTDSLQKTVESLKEE